MARHKTRFIEFGDHAADVDKGIADLILALWKLNISTSNSCENNVPKGFIWIAFPTSMDAENFLDIIANPYEEECDSFYQHVLRYWRPWSNKEEMRLQKTDWLYSVLPHDNLNHEGEKTTRIGPACIIFSVSIRFPRKHLPIVMERIQAKLDETTTYIEHLLACVPSA